MHFEMWIYPVELLTLKIYYIVFSNYIYFRKLVFKYSRARDRKVREKSKKRNGDRTMHEIINNDRKVRNT